jgi:hypothetical protein
MGVKRTHCKRRHPLRGDNLYVSPSGTRTCKACRKAGKAAWRLKQGHVPVDPTRCRKGHPFDAENTVIKKSGQRMCRICMTATAKAYRATRDHEKENENRRKPGGLADKHRTAGAMAERERIVAFLRSTPCSVYEDAKIKQIEEGAHIL